MEWGKGEMMISECVCIAVCRIERESQYYRGSVNYKYILVDSSWVYKMLLGIALGVYNMRCLTT